MAYDVLDVLQGRQHLGDVPGRGSGCGAEVGRQGRVAVEVDHRVAPVPVAQHLADVQVAVHRQRRACPPRRRGRPARTSISARCSDEQDVGPGVVPLDQAYGEARARPAPRRPAAGPGPGSSGPAGRRRAPGASARPPHRGRPRSPRRRAADEPEGSTSLAPGPGPAVLGPRAGTTARRRPAPSDRRRARATRPVPPASGDPAKPASASRRSRLGRGMRSDQRLGHPLHDHRPADDPRLVGLVDAHRPLGLVVERDPAEPGDPEARPRPPSGCAVGGARRARHRRPASTATQASPADVTGSARWPCSPATTRIAWVPSRRSRLSDRHGARGRPAR